MAWDYADHFESTDDAFIAARQIAIAPKIPGYVTAVPVTDNQHVAAGATIARIDPRDYQVALDQAKAQVGVAEAGIRNVDAQISVQKAQIEASQSQVDQARATLVFAQQQAARYQQLAQKGAGSVQNAQQYHSQLDQQQAALKSAEAARSSRSGRSTPSKRAARERGGQPRAGHCAARPGAAQPVLYRRDRGGAGPRRQSQRRPPANMRRRARTLPCSCPTTSG